MNLRSWAIALVSAVLTSAPAMAASGEPAIERVVSIVEGPTALDHFRYPQDVAADYKRGVFVVADSGNQRLAVFDATGRSRGVISLAPREGDPWSEYRDLAIDARGRMFVVDMTEGLVEVLNARGSRLGELLPILPQELLGHVVPQAVDVAVGGRIYLLYGGDRPGFAVLEPDGTPVTSVGFAPKEIGPFQGPVAIAVNRDETRIAVVDPTAELQILVYTVTGEPVVAFGEHGDGEGTFSVAVDAAWDEAGNLWVTDTVRHVISVFDGRGTYLGMVGGYGTGPGQFYYPVACDFVAANRLVVLERAGARFQVLEVSAPGSPSTDAHLETNSSGETGALLATK